MFLADNKHVTKSTITMEVLKYTSIGIHVDRAAQSFELLYSVYIAAKIADEAIKVNETIPMSPAINLRVSWSPTQRTSLCCQTRAPFGLSPIVLDLTF